LNHHKKIKWIIEVAALTPEEIINITNVIKNCIQESFDRDFHSHIFIKSSTGFYVTNDGKPNGATKESIRLMIEHAENLPVKAAGGVKSLSEAVEMIQLGVKRIGTSSAKAIVEGLTSAESY
jgi:deoxyribose-phosphate aldolase